MISLWPLAIHSILYRLMRDMYPKCVYANLEFPGTYVPRCLCSPNLCSPVPMFPGTDVPRFFTLIVVISINNLQTYFSSTIAG